MCKEFYVLFSGYIGDATPAEAFESNTLPPCVDCQRPIEDYAYFDDDYDDYYCEACATQYAQSVQQEALAFAQEHCAITREIPPFYSDLTYRCTREEYDAGDRESYTENSYRCMCRHSYTNYEELIAGYSREGGIESQLFYEAIRSVIDQLVDDEIDNKELIRTSPEDDVRPENEDDDEEDEETDTY